MANLIELAKQNADELLRRAYLDAVAAGELPEGAELTGTVEIPMVTHTSSYMYELQFCEILYMSGKLYVVVATRGAYDEKYEIDEDTLELIGPTPFY